MVGFPVGVPAPPSARLMRLTHAQWCLACMRTAIFGPSQGKKKDATHCHRHRLEGHVDLTHKRCQHPQVRPWKKVTGSRGESEFD